MYSVIVYNDGHCAQNGILLEITDNAPVYEGKMPITTRFSCPPNIDVIHGIALGFISEITGINVSELEDLIGIHDEYFQMTKTENL
jgi:hypothetical protein